jgi:hypothetical protein
MRAVYKFPLDITGRTTIMASSLTQIVLCAIDPASGNPALWLDADWPNEPRVERHFFVFGTGWAIEPHYKHVGSVIDPGGFVWHVYERQP